MPSVSLPAGLVPVRSLTTGDILTGHRSTAIRYELLTQAEASKGPLTGVTGGSLDWTTAASVHGGGKLEVVDVGQDVDWLNDRIRPVITIAGLPEQPLGVFLVAKDPGTFTGTGRTWTLQLVDKTSILEQDQVESTYTAPAGTVITAEVAALIASTGEINVAITPSTATLPSAIVWEPGTTKLRIVNDLLAAANYLSLYADFTGQLRAEPWTRPAARPIAWEFLDGEKSIYSPDFTQDVDRFGIPNKVTVVGQSSGSVPALTSVPATNEDPVSPYSYPRRGRWISKVERGVEIADQTTLDSYARRRLIELTSPTSSIEVQHAFLPGLAINNAVRLRRVPAGIDARHVVSKTEITTDPTALVKTTLTQVVDL